jgi:hypothetical protein
MRRPLNEKRFGDCTVKQMPVEHMISQQSEVIHAMLRAAFDGIVIPESMLCVEQLNVMKV